MHRKPLLPKGAKRVFKGMIFDVYHWQQRQFDGSTRTFEMLKRPDTAQVIAVRDNKIMVCRQEQPGQKPFWSIPGGRVEPNETPLAAAKREMLEETGYASDDWKTWLRERPYSKTDWLVYVYIAHNCYRATPQKLDAGERIKTQWMTLDKFLKLSDDPMFYERELVRHLYRMRLYPKEKAKFARLLFNK